MAIGTALAIGLSLAAANTATQVIGARKASNASKDAAKIQTQSADRAMRTIDDTWSPYVNAGRQAMGTLGRLTTAPAGARYAAPPQPGMGQPPPRMPSGPAARPRPAGMPQTGFAAPRTLGGLARPPAQPQFQQGGGRTVSLQAPNGEIEQVPAHLAEQFIARGARPVN